MSALKCGSGRSLSPRVLLVYHKDIINVFYIDLELRIFYIKVPFAVTLKIKVAICFAG